MGELGLVGTGSLGVDLPPQRGRTSHFLSPFLSALFASCCRILSQVCVGERRERKGRMRRDEADFLLFLEPSDPPGKLLEGRICMKHTDYPDVDLEVRGGRTGILPVPCGKCIISVEPEVQTS